MREHDDSGDNSLQDLLNQVPDKHHVETRLEGALSINGRHPRHCTYGTDYCGEVDMAIAADGTWFHEGCRSNGQSCGNCLRVF